MGASDNWITLVSTRKNKLGFSLTVTVPRSKIAVADPAAKTATPSASLVPRAQA